MSDFIKKIENLRKDMEKLGKKEEKRDDVEYLEDLFKMK